ncbi:MAG: DedA family protein [Azovibrio sp.]
MISEWIAEYGYLIVFVGTLLEGETVLLAAGFAIHQGMLDWRLTWMIAVTGATLGDQGYFLLGSWKGTELIDRFPSLKARVIKVQELMERHHTLFILILRFLYGLRAAGPIILGAGKLPMARFSILNLIGAVIWASLGLGTGYIFGLTLETLLTHIRHIEEVILAGIVAAGILLWLWHHRPGCRKQKQEKPEVKEVP